MCVCASYPVEVEIHRHQREEEGDREAYPALDLVRRDQKGREGEDHQQQQRHDHVLNVERPERRRAKESGEERERASDTQNGRETGGCRCACACVRACSCICVRVRVSQHD